MTAPPNVHAPIPSGRAMLTVDERIVRAPVREIFAVARAVEEWPAYLRHYRFVRMRPQSSGGVDVVEMSANRPFGPLMWPTWWVSEMAVNSQRPSIRFLHIGGITKGMDVEWTFEPVDQGRSTRVRIVHVWDGPPWPVIGSFAATTIIGPVFIHGIASRTLAGLAGVAERAYSQRETGAHER